jgi:hypothetical protein
MNIENFESYNEIYCDDDIYDHNYKEMDGYNNFVQTNQKIINVQKKLAKSGEVFYFGTLSFQYDLKPDEAIRAASVHWRRVQKHALGRNWIKKGIAPLTGLIVMETHPIFNKMTTRRFSSCHFHHLIYSHPKLDRNKLVAASGLDRVFLEAARGLTHKNKRWQLVSRHGTRVLPVYDTMQICGYVAKEAWHYEWEWDNRVRYLCRDGVI